MAIQKLSASNIEYNCFTRTITAEFPGFPSPRMVVLAHVWTGADPPDLPDEAIVGFKPANETLVHITHDGWPNSGKVRFAAWSTTADDFTPISNFKTCCVELTLCGSGGATKIRVDPASLTNPNASTPTFHKRADGEGGGCWQVTGMHVHGDPETFTETGSNPYPSCGCTEEDDCIACGSSGIFKDSAVTLDVSENSSLCGCFGVSSATMTRSGEEWIYQTTGCGHDLTYRFYCDSGVLKLDITCGGQSITGVTADAVSAGSWANGSVSIDGLSTCCPDWHNQEFLNVNISWSECDPNCETCAGRRIHKANGTMTASDTCAFFGDLPTGVTAVYQSGGCEWIASGSSNFCGNPWSASLFVQNGAWKMTLTINGVSSTVNASEVTSSPPTYEGTFNAHDFLPHTESCLTQGDPPELVPCDFQVTFELPQCMETTA